MTQIKLTPSQIAKLTPLKDVGGYQSLTAIVSALIAIYADDLNSRLVSSTNTIPSSPNTTPLSTNTIPSSTNTALTVPVNSTQNQSAPSSPPVNKPPRVKFTI